jgi:hypothetical protein
MFSTFLRFGFSHLRICVLVVLDFTVFCHSDFGHH